MLVGATATKSEIVTSANTAQAFGSGLVPVYATPAMIALMEGAAVLVTSKGLEPEEGTVGVRVDIEHIAATPLNKRITAKATLIRIEGRKLFFEIEAHDEDKLIGKGTHERAIINTEKFLAKLGIKA